MFKYRIEKLYEESPWEDSGWYWYVSKKINISRGFNLVYYRERFISFNDALTFVRRKLHG